MLNSSSDRKKKRNLGKLRFELFNEQVQFKLMEFCSDLGYNDKYLVFDILGEFETTFQIPIIPRDPNNILKNNYILNTN